MIHMLASFIRREKEKKRYGGKFNTCITLPCFLYLFAFPSSRFNEDYQISLSLKPNWPGERGEKQPGDDI